MVISDVLGLNKGFRPKFAREYADIGSEISEAIERYNKDVKDGNYPTEAESYHQKKQ